MSLKAQYIDKVLNLFKTIEIENCVIKKIIISEQPTRNLKFRIKDVYLCKINKILLTDDKN